MNTERKAVVIFEDEQMEVKQLKNILPSELVILALTTMEACRSFVQDSVYADQLLGEAVLIACIIDGRISPETFGIADGLELTSTIRKNPRFDDVLLISNSGGGRIVGAHGHLEKVYSRKKKYLPHIEKIVETWQSNNKAHLDLSREDLTL